MIKLKKEHLTEAIVLFLVIFSFIFFKGTSTGHSILVNLPERYLFNFFSFPMMILYAGLYGVTMKTADLLNEHKLKWFKGSNILFGFLEGFFAVLLIIGNIQVANLVLAQVIAFIVRGRVDYRNHMLAAAIIIVSFLFFSEFSPWLFLIFFFIFAISGHIKDLVDDVLKLKKGFKFHFSERAWYYYIPTLIYSIYTGIWIVFFVFVFYMAFYDLTKFAARKYGYI